jgi:imidazoleglycerol phosphate synthase glutamine amidotransferase subunit HisH
MVMEIYIVSIKHVSILDIAQLFLLIKRDIISADSLPGVGAFKVAMDELANKDLIEPIKEFVKKVII